MKKLSTGKKGRYPDKTSINLVMEEEEHGNPVLQIGLFIAFLAVLAVFAKFAVADRIAEASAAESAYVEMQNQIRDLQEYAEEYDSVRSEYSRYSNGYLNEEELLEVDRLEVLDLIDTCVLTQADVQSISVTGSTVTLTINQTQLPTVSSIVSALQDDERTGYVTVSTAGTNDEKKGGQFVTANIVIELQTGGAAS